MDPVVVLNFIHLALMLIWKVCKEEGTKNFKGGLFRKKLGSWKLVRNRQKRKKLLIYLKIWFSY